MYTHMLQMMTTINFLHDGFKREDHIEKINTVFVDQSVSWHYQ